MTTITENDLKKLEDLINTRFNQLQEEIKDLKKSNQNIELGQAKIEGQLKGWEPSINKISDLAEKTGELKGCLFPAF